MIETLSHALLLVAVMTIAAASDAAWVRLLRPRLAPRFGWRDLHPSEIIPTRAWMGGALVVWIIFIFVSRTGAAVGLT